MRWIEWRRLAGHGGNPVSTGWPRGAAGVRLMAIVGLDDFLD